MPKILYSVAAAILLSLPGVSADACGDVADQMIRSSSFAVTPSLAYQCMRSIPIDPGFSFNITEEARKYLSFYSAGTYFKHAVTPELDIDPVDINSTLDNIEANIKAGKYSSEYDVHKDLFDLFGAVKDGHVKFMPVCVVGAFVFYHDYSLIQLAATPDSLPETYIARVNTGTGLPEVLEKVAKINDRDPVQYLEDMAKSHPETNWIDPDARFNELLLHLEAGTWQRGNFAARRLYDTEPLTITFAGGKSVDVQWKAQFQNPRPDAAAYPVPFNDATSFWSSICIRSDEELASVTGDPPYMIPQQFSNAGKIKRDTIEKRGFWPSDIMFATQNGAIGYYKLDDNTAVITVSTFSPVDDTADAEAFIVEFSHGVAKVIQAAKNSGAERLLIDVIGNGGGLTVLGRNMARQLFPTEQNFFFGTNMRWNPTLDAMLMLGDQAEIASTYFDLGKIRRIDGSEFKNFRDMLGPIHRDGDLFTYISIPDEDEIIRDTSPNIYTDYLKQQPFKTENVVLVSSGLCASTCAIFAEALHSHGVRVVVIGGRPRKGPMQGIGGIKGSQVLTFDQVAAYTNILLKSYIAKDPSSTVAQSLPKPMRLRTLVSSINFLNSWRKDDGQYLPIEFLYTPAEWKIFSTLEMSQSARKLHAAVRDVAWGGAKDMSGGPYTPINGVDGSGFKWPEGSSSGGAGGGGVGTNNGSGKANIDARISLGALIWRTMQGGL